MRQCSVISAILLACVAGSAAMGQGRVEVQNGLNTPSVFRFTNRTNGVVTQVNLIVGGNSNIPAGANDLFDLQIIPSDQGGSGARMVAFSLTRLASAQNGGPVIFKGGFGTVCCGRRRHRHCTTVRTTIFTDDVAADGSITTLSARIMSY